MDSKQVQLAMISKLAQSGLDADDIKLLKLKPYSTEDAAKLGLPLTAAGFEIPYFFKNGKVNCHFRYRLLEKPPASNGFAAAAAAKPPKYLQLKDSAPGVYLPPSVDWEEIFADPNIPIQITEGELKAAAACKLKYPTIGLGGVWCFKSKKLGLEFLPILEECTWGKRKVAVVYDSDAVVNPDVVMAENQLCRQLLKRGSVPVVVRLPQEDGKKQGLDDYLVAQGTDLYDELVQNAQEWGHSRELHEMNEEVIYVRDPGLIMRLNNLQRMSPESFSAHQYANRTFTIQIQTPKGVKLEERSTPREWIKWKARAEVEKAVYEPGQNRFTEGRLNVWPGWGCEPVKGDLKPWKKLVDYLFKGLPLEKRYFEQWLAYPLQYPGIKMFVAIAVWGRVHGTGKSLVGNTLKRIYGKNFAEIDKDKLDFRNFNGWAENKQFVLGDEVTAGEKRGVSEHLKNLITRETVEINIKHLPTYTIRDCINWYLTSNKADAVFMEDSDRRFFIHEVSGAPLEHSFYLDFVDWRDNRGGAEALFYHLLHYNLDGFSPHAPAMNTAAKDEMRKMSKSAMGSWIQELRDVPENVLRLDSSPLDWTLATTVDLLNLYDPSGRTGTTLNAFGRELANADIQKINKGKPVLLSDGRRVELWVVGHKPSAKNPRPAWLANQYEKEHGIVRKKY